MSLVLSIGYIFAAYAVWGGRWVIEGKPTVAMNYVARIFDAVTFTTSMLALASICDKTVLSLLGNLKPFLIIAGLCGACYSVHALFKS